jgi:D-3-phosphoglycerate dehydrogenase / 2-oxoglutarate reductase
MDMIPEGNMIVVSNKDQPGVIGLVGNSFGDAGINIADMVISREKQKDCSFLAMMLIKTDSKPTDAQLAGLRGKAQILSVKSVTLPERS